MTLFTTLILAVTVAFFTFIIYSWFINWVRIKKEAAEIHDVYANVGDDENRWFTFASNKKNIKNHPDGTPYCTRLLKRNIFGLGSNKFYENIFKNERGIQTDYVVLCTELVDDKEDKNNIRCTSGPDPMFKYYTIPGTTFVVPIVMAKVRDFWVLNGWFETLDGTKIIDFSTNLHTNEKDKTIQDQSKVINIIERENVKLKNKKSNLKQENDELRKQKDKPPLTPEEIIRIQQQTGGGNMQYNPSNQR